MMKRNLVTGLLTVFSMSLGSFSVLAANHMASDRISDIRNTKHNFASGDLVDLPNGGTRDVVSSENRVCIFCHTPHGDPNKATKPFLWNRSDSAKTLLDAEKYTSSSLNIDNTNVALGDKSKMCLSCHDGTVAIGQLDMNSSTTDAGTTVPQTVTMSGNNVTGGVLNSNSTANLGTDFKNDHPFGFTYDSTLASNDGELIDPAGAQGDHIGVRASRKVTNFNNALNIAGTAGAAGATNPITASTRIAVPLEASVTAPTDGQTTFVNVASSGKVECTTCHDPHIRSTDNTENIKFLRLHRFQKISPVDGAFNIDSDINCLACHKKSGWADSAHAMETDAPYTYLSNVATDRDMPSDKAVWQTACISCHNSHTVTGARWLLRQAEDNSVLNDEVSDIDKSCYECHSSTSVLDPASGTVADIESVALTGGHASFTFVSGDTSHRPINADLEEAAADLQVRHATCSDCHNPHRLQKGTHTPNGTADNNLVSGALTGVSGLDTTAAGFDPYVAETAATPTVGPATKEYEICFKCHSSYGHGATEIDITKFSNTVNEFSAAATSVHPVVNSSSNTNITANLMEAPFNTGINTQTMYCSDCHTNTDDTGSGFGSGAPQDPKGSHNNEVAACETCHVSDQYNYNAAATPLTSGFACASAVDCVAPDAAGNSNNLHVFHASVAVAGDDKNICSNCHVKVPHGWKNKALLGDINDAQYPDTRYYGTGAETDRVMLDIVTLQASGQWTKASCGTVGGCH